MAKKATVKLQCKECGVENEVEIYLSLNAQEDTEAYAQMLTGKLFNFECTGCGKPGHINHDMLFHDIVHRALIHYVVSPESAERAYESIKNLLAEEGVKALPEDYTIRVVKSQNALREKAMMFDHGLDDRIMEILKGLCVVNIHRDHPEVTEIKEALFLTSNCKWILQLLGAKPMTAEIPMTKYDEIRRKMSEFIEQTEIENYAVDGNWALKVVRSHQEKYGTDVPQG